MTVQPKGGRKEGERGGGVGRSDGSTSGPLFRSGVNLRLLCFAGNTSQLLLRQARFTETLTGRRGWVSEKAKQGRENKNCRHRKDKEVFRGEGLIS